ncbi:hypothetical protein GSY69_05720 [Brevibacterium sp. 5221]|uniref:Uncharacterized protein n=1 Tax=Brevibacterium rongguiense TaxID=2695267 RepID=A0A6N9H6A3_9MICO|nr:MULTISPECIES: hypothetical protein [Brevibacterium]MYM19479.1 hypothetical protein [Brevibacterium rongguiense]WAL41205.1 hypothetical protein BRM1_04960 [Brevibacterium sp. BRM-1]
MSRTVVVTPFGRADQLAAACVLSGIGGDVVPVGDFTAIVASGTDVEAGNAAAAKISELARDHEVLLLVRSDEQIDAGHYRNGAREADVPAGLALTNLPGEVESLLLEALDPADVEGRIDTASMSRMQASAAAMTPARAALARTALLWMVVALLAVIAVVAGALVALAGTGPAWFAVGLGALVLGFSLFRVSRLLAGRA